MKQKDHQFWGTEPLFHYEKKHEGPVEDLLSNEVDSEALNLPEGYEWEVVEGNSEDLDAETIEFAAKHFFNLKNTTLLTADYLDWFLQRQEKSLCLVVRIQKTGKVAALLASNPMALNARDSLIEGVHVRLLCVHKSLRGKRMAVVVIKEFKR